MIHINPGNRGASRQKGVRGGCSAVISNNLVAGCAWDSGPWASWLLRLGETDDVVIEGNAFVYLKPEKDGDVWWKPIDLGLPGDGREGAQSTRIGRNVFRYRDVDGGPGVVDEQADTLYHRKGTNTRFFV